MPEITNFDDAARVMYRGARGIEIHPGPKNRGLAFENGQKGPKSRVLTMPLESCTVGHMASNTPETQTPWTSPRKRPKMPEITSFDNAARGMYRGSRGIEILPGPKNRGLAHENGQKCPKSSRDPKTMDYSPKTARNS